MNINITSKEAILAVSKEIIKEKGWKYVNIRNVAEKCDISIGTIYNYFDNKNDLIAETVQSIWREIFQMPEENSDIFSSFKSCIIWAFESMKKGDSEYPRFMSLHSLSFIGNDKQTGQEIMQKSWTHIKNKLKYIISVDEKVKPNAFNEALTENDFVEIVFTLVISSFMQGDYNSTPIIELIDRILY